MSFADLAPLADRAALYSALRQEALLDAIGGNAHRWDADLTAGTITFTPHATPEHPVVVGAHLIATIAPEPRTLRWAWAQPNGADATVATQLRDAGAAVQNVTLTTAEVPFPESIEGELDDWIAQAAHTVAGAAVELTGRAPYFSAPVEGGTRAVFLLDAPLPNLSVADALTALPRVIASVPLSDPRTALWNLARLAGWNLQWTDEAFTGAIISDATASATVRFDENARITGIEATV